MRKIFDAAALSAAFFISTATINSVRERQSPDWRGICFMPEAGLACHSRLISASGVAVPEQKSPRLLRALCAVESSDIRMVQAKVIRTNTYRNALRIRLQLLLESTLTGPLQVLKTKNLRNR